MLKPARATRKTGTSKRYAAGICMVFSFFFVASVAQACFKYNSGLRFLCAISTNGRIFHTRGSIQSLNTFYSLKPGCSTFSCVGRI